MPDATEGHGGRFAGLHSPLDLGRWCGILQTWPIAEGAAPPEGFAGRLHEFDAAASRLAPLPADLMCPLLEDDLQFALGLEFASAADRWRAITVRALEVTWRIAEAQEEEAATLATLSRVRHDLRHFQEEPWRAALDLLSRSAGLDDQTGSTERANDASALERLAAVHGALERLARTKRLGGRPDHPRTFFAARLAECAVLSTGLVPQLFAPAGAWRELLRAAEILVSFPMAPSGQGVEDMMRRVAELPLWSDRISELARLFAPDAIPRKIWCVADLPSAGLEILAS
ncbi:hypothetical protein ABLE93_20660 [Xanthobacter sp. KR7-65]|uniref:hypothetical protein n=1 Tax=Xanthobacter sp. KR7-65 TaxID=3156612 RepID=UPI0032B4F9DF